MFPSLTRLHPALCVVRRFSVVTALCVLPAFAALADEELTSYSADGYTVDVPAQFESLPNPDFTISYGQMQLPDGSDGGTIFGMGAAPVGTLEEMLQDLVEEDAVVVGPETVTYNDVAFEQRRFTVDIPLGTMRGVLLFAEDPRADGTVLRVVLVHLNIDESLMDSRDRQILGSLRRAEGADDAEAEQAFWARIRSSNDRADYEAYLEAYPDGRYAALARNNLRRLDRMGR